MRKKNSSLAGLLNLNGSLCQGVRFHEPYRFNHLLEKNHKPNVKKITEDLLGWGEFVVEKMKRIKALHGSFRNFGMSPYLEKLMKKSFGKIL